MKLKSLAISYRNVLAIPYIIMWSCTVLLIFVKNEKEMCLF